MISCQATVRSRVGPRPPASSVLRQVTPAAKIRTRAASSDAAESSTVPKKSNDSLVSGLKELVKPFEDSRANARFLALALGGMLCSIATLIHDSYLPVFMREELGMTNTVRVSFCMPVRLDLTPSLNLGYSFGSTRIRGTSVTHPPTSVRRVSTCVQRIGSVQALSQLLCQVAKSFSGVLGDLLGSQVKILVFGTALTVLCKPMFAVSSCVFSAFGAVACLWCIMLGKMMDRVSKGFREAPTKALISQTARDAGETADSAFSASRTSFNLIHVSLHEEASVLGFVRPAAQPSQSVVPTKGFDQSFVPELNHT